MAVTDSPSTSDLRAIIESYIKERRDAKLEKLDPDDPKRSELLEKYQTANWLEDAAKRAGQLQAVTHSLKPIHPDARGTNLYAAPSTLPSHGALGTHCLGSQFASDVVGNAAALDVYKLLQKVCNNQSLLELATHSSDAFMQALSSDAKQAAAWSAAFAGLTQARGKTASHTLAKQVYWQVGEAAHDDAAFHLLVPLFVTSLAHRVYTTVQEHRFGDAAKLARDAKKAKAHSDVPTRDYPNHAIQNFGGTKPQNISQLNSERGGRSILFASIPPNWSKQSIQPLLGKNSFFSTFTRRKVVLTASYGLTKFLKSDPPKIELTRSRVHAYITTLVDEFLEFTAEYRQLPGGWSSVPECKLSVAEKIWLDTAAAVSAIQDTGAAVPQDVPQQICLAFANWLNARLQKGKLPVGDDEAFVWAREVKRLIDSELKEWSDDDTTALI